MEVMKVECDTKDSLCHSGIILKRAESGNGRQIGVSNQLSGKYKLLKATVFLRCQKTNHDDCVDLLNEVRLLNNITYAETANAIVGNEEYCVIADAVVKSDEIEQFEEKLESIIQNGKAGKKALFISQ